jgi:hypothetical protein
MVKDVVGEQYGKLTIVQELPRYVLPSGQKTRRVLCKCECGTLKEVQLSNLYNKKTKSCKNCVNYNRKNLIGSKFGIITIIEHLPDKITNGRRIRIVQGRCDCGSVKTYRVANIRYQKSCGCLTVDIIRKTATTHGLTNHPLHTTWGNMINRCYNSKTDSFYLYGARGIGVCRKWRNSYKEFYDWSVANGWQKGLEIDRYPNKKGNYQPSNCRWVTQKVNQNNKTTNRRFLYDGKKMTISEISDTCGIRYKTLYNRIVIKKMPIKMAISTRVMSSSESAKNAQNIRWRDHSENSKK